MAKFKVEVELNWVNGCSIDDEVQEMITKEIADMVINKVGEKLEKEAKEIIEKLAVEKFSEVFNNPIKRVNKYGEPVEEITWENYIKDQLDEAMNTKVDCYGKPSQYNSKERYMWMVDQKIKSGMEKLSQQIAKDVNIKIKDHMTDEFKNMICSQLVSTFKLFDKR